MQRRGFTLLELLIATAVFLFGFMAAYTMFLAGVKNRQLADSVTRSSLAATSIISEIRMRAGRENAGAPLPPSDYNGDGFAKDGPENDAYISYSGMPGILYRVRNATDIANEPGNIMAVAIAFELLVINEPVPSSGLDFNRPGVLGISTPELAKRMRSLLDRGQDPRTISIEELDAKLLASGRAQSYQVVVQRQASWLP